jgi:hypothetical protein
MKKIKIQSIVNEVTNRIINTIFEGIDIQEGSGFDSIFTEMKAKLPNISILPDNMINVDQYKEHEIIDALKSIGYEYKKPISGKLHFFNKKSSISLYLIQSAKKISLMP